MLHSSRSPWPSTQQTGTSINVHFSKVTFTSYLNSKYPCKSYHLFEFLTLEKGFAA